MTPSTVALLHGHPLHVGGVESHLLSLVRRADPSRHRFVVVAPCSESFAQRARAAGAEPVGWEPRHVLDVRSLGRLVDLLRSRSVGLLHVHDLRATLFGRLVASRLRLPAVVTIHLPDRGWNGLGPWASLERRLHAAVGALLRRGFPDRIIYVSSRFCEEAGDDPRRAVVIENGVDLDAFSSPALVRPPDTSVIVCVARLDRQKGIDVLLEALALLGKAPPVELWIAGDGPLRSELEARAGRLGLAGRVRFLGFRDDVPGLLACGDLFVLPSRFEAMPIALLEAMAAGLAVVGTRVGEVAGLIEDGVDGRLVAPGDAAALGVALRQLLGDAPLRQRLGAAARRRAEQFGELRMVRRIEAVYADVRRARQAAC